MTPRIVNSLLKLGQLNCFKHPDYPNHFFYKAIDSNVLPSGGSLNCILFEKEVSTKTFWVHSEIWEMMGKLLTPDDYNSMVESIRNYLNHNEIIPANKGLPEFIPTTMGLAGYTPKPTGAMVENEEGAGGYAEIFWTRVYDGLVPCENANE